MHLDSINKKLSYLCIFEFDAIPQILYYKENEFLRDYLRDYIRDDSKITDFKTQILDMKDKTKEEKYKYIASCDTIFGNDLFLIIDINDINDSLIKKTHNFINSYFDSQDL